MEDFSLSQSALVVTAIAAMLSFAAGFFLFQRHAYGDPLLAYEPRRRSPWGPLVLVIPLLILSQGVAQIFMAESSMQEMSPAEFVIGALVFSSIQLGYVWAAMAWLSWDKQADSADLGLPATSNLFWKDVVRGTTACAAALMPVLIVNFLLTNLFQSKEGHPMIEKLMDFSSPTMLVVASFSAVVVAPVFEEFVFRVLLQGWLERLEDEAVQFEATQREPEIVEGELVEPELVDLPLEQPQHSQPPSRTQLGWFGLLPHGWLPIIISGVLFGLAHLGHGLAPVPLILLGVVLGYLYQRTHRLVPCVVAHMLFNGYSMLLLWLSLDKPPA